MVTMGNVWDRSMACLRDHASAFLPIAILLLYLPVVVTGLLPVLMSGAARELRIVYSVLALFVTLVILWGQLAATLTAIDPAARWTANARRSLTRLPLAIGLYLLLGLAFLIATLPILFFAHGAATMADPGWSTGMHLSPALGWALALYMIALIVVMMWLLARLILLNPVIVAEQRGFGSIAHSFSMTRGLAWRIIGVFVLYLIVTAIAQIATRLVFGSIFTLVAGGAITAILTALVVGAVSTFFYVIAAAFIGRLYVAVRDVEKDAPYP